MNPESNEHAYRLVERKLDAREMRDALARAAELIDYPDYRDWGGEVARGYKPIAQAFLQFEAITREHLEALERWAGEQNAGNAFAEQVRWWALTRLAVLRGDES